MTEARVEILDPTIERSVASATLSPRLDTFAGKTIGVIWNGRPSGDHILGQVLDALKQEQGVKEVVFRAKPFLGNVAPDEMLEELVRTCDAVITGVGD